jgi:SAM-dependent methyltransferase
MNVFNTLYASQYDSMYLGKSYLAECDLIDEAVKRFAGRRPLTLLDVGCGTGGHAFELSKRGYQVTGVDLSAEMLAAAQLKAETLDVSQKPLFVLGDARNFGTGTKHDIAIMMFAVVGYLVTNADVQAGLSNVRAHLEPGALFICDFWYGPSVLTERPSDRFREIAFGHGDRLLRAASTVLDTRRHLAEVTFRLWQFDGERIANEATEVHSMRYFFPMEFELLLANAGFELKSMTAFPSLDKPLSDDAWNALVVAQAV